MNWIKSIGISEESRTTADNVKAPTKLFVFAWVVSAWNAVSLEMIHKSFKACDLTIVRTLDGSDNEIHAVKELGFKKDLEEKCRT